MECAGEALAQPSSEPVNRSYWASKDAFGTATIREGDGRCFEIRSWRGTC
jgi:hypothetical protein